MEIKKVFAREVLDSRGNPTVEAVVTTKTAVGTAIVPSGASTGTHEALELRDKGKRYGGKGVKKAVANVNDRIAKKLKGMNVKDQRGLDSRMITLDGSPNKRNLGANAMLAVSMAAARASALETGIPLYERIAKLVGTKKATLPVPFANVINGGKHAGGKLAMQEFMIAPVNARSFSDATQSVAETYHTLKAILKKKYGTSAVNVGDEGGFAPPIDTAEEALSMLQKAIKEAGYEKKMRIAMDPAASEFYKNNLYRLNRLLSGEELTKYYLKLIKRFPIISIEDAFDQDDFDSFASLSAATPIQVVGDDLLVTNTSRIRMAIDKKLCRALLLKVNQIGTVTEALDAARLAMSHKWKVMVSHRSGETEDTFIADLAVGLGCGQIKLGAPARSERVAKYNRLLRIEEESGLKYHRFRN